MSVSIPVDVMRNDTDDRDEMTLRSWEFVSDQGGVVILSPGEGRNGFVLLYTPPVDYIGQDSFTYVIEDELGQTSTATVRITIDKIPAITDAVPPELFNAD